MSAPPRLKVQVFRRKERFKIYSTRLKRFTWKEVDLPGMLIRIGGRDCSLVRKVVDIIRDVSRGFAVPTRIEYLPTQRLRIGERRYRYCRAKVEVLGDKEVLLKIGERIREEVGA